MQIHLRFQKEITRFHQRCVFFILMVALPFSTVQAQIVWSDGFNDSTSIFYGAKGASISSGKLTLKSAADDTLWALQSSALDVRKSFLIDLDFQVPGSQKSSVIFLLEFKNKSNYQGLQSINGNYSWVICKEGNTRKYPLSGKNMDHLSGTTSFQLAKTGYQLTVLSKGEILAEFPGEYLGGKQFGFLLEPGSTFSSDSVHVVYTSKETAYAEHEFTIRTAPDTLLFSDELGFYTTSRKDNHFRTHNQYKSGKTYFYDFSDLAGKDIFIRMEYYAEDPGSSSASGIFLLTQAGSEFHYLANVNGEGAIFSGFPGAVGLLAGPLKSECPVKISQSNYILLSCIISKNNLSFFLDGCPVDFGKQTLNAQVQSIGLVNYGQDLRVRNFSVFQLRNK